ncbi:MAG: lysine--tRNA ligase [Chlamydiae bacterium]|nr:lysine--tRNA ligase [Chlamydiota bacterium]
MQEPVYHKYEEFQNRLSKLKDIEALGICPYPHKFSPQNSAQALQEKYAEEAVGDSDAGEKGLTPEVSLAGRLVLFRTMGKNIFAQLQDASGRLQLMFNRETTHVAGLNPEASDITALKFIEKKIDLGDILGVKGHLFKTHKGELTLFVKEITLLCKTLLPLPDKHSGLADKELRYRKRWLDLISSKEVFDTFKTRSEILKFLRAFLDQQGFMEVETPILQNIYGGAEARPFTTKINALNQEMFLRISLEISLKKLLIGGYNKIFEIGKVFRNEGLDKTHNPEFTMIELYAAYFDYNDIMTLLENLFAGIAKKLFGTTAIGKRLDKRGNLHDIDLKTPWKRISMKDSIHEYGKVDVDALSDEELRSYLLNNTEADPKKVKEATRGLLIACLFEELVEHHLIQPHHVIDHPIETTPLCKLHRNPKERSEGIVERFETFILGYEFSNAYTELNDPILQRKLLEDQALKKNQGNEEAHPMDEEFIEAICQGMPPTGGLGIGIDRMVMLFTGEPSIRDVLFFPIMRPEQLS